MFDFALFAVGPLQIEVGELKGRLTEVISNCDALCKRFESIDVEPQTFNSIIDKEPHNSWSNHVHNFFSYYWLYYHWFCFIIYINHSFDHKVLWDKCKIVHWLTILHHCVLINCILMKFLNSFNIANNWWMYDCFRRFLNVQYNLNREINQV